MIRLTRRCSERRLALCSTLGVANIFPVQATLLLRRRSPCSR
jgi:hypothetical protein